MSCSVRESRRWGGTWRRKWCISLIDYFTRTGQGPLFLVLEVRRDNIYNDTVQKLRAASPAALACPLRVKFEGEEGIDEGGLVKEFFHLVLPKFFRYGRRVS